MDITGFIQPIAKLIFQNGSHIQTNSTHKFAFERHEYEIFLYKDIIFTSKKSTYAVDIIDYIRDNVVTSALKTN